MSRKQKSPDYEVKAIKDKRETSRGVSLYLVQWKGYAEETWEPIDNLLNCLDLVESFEVNLAEMEKRKTRSSGQSPEPKSRTSKLPRSTSRGRKPATEEKSPKKSGAGRKRTLSRSSRSPARSRSQSPSRRSARSKGGSIISNSTASPKSTSSAATSLLSSAQSSPAKSSSTITYVAFDIKKRSPPIKRKSPIKDAVSNLLRFRKTVASSAHDAARAPKMSFDDMASKIKLGSLFLSEGQNDLSLNVDSFGGVESSQIIPKLPPNGAVAEKRAAPPCYAISPRSSLRKRSWWNRVCSQKLAFTIFLGILLAAILVLAYFNRVEIYKNCESLVLHSQAKLKELKAAIERKIEENRAAVPPPFISE